MFRKLSIVFLVVIGMTAMSALTIAQTKETMGIGAVKVNPALAEAAAAARSASALQRLQQAMDTQLIDRFQNTRKFTLVNRSQLDEAMKEITLALSGNLNKNDPKLAKAMEGAGAKYLLVTTIDSFNDVRKELMLEGGRTAGTRRAMAVSAVAILYDTTTLKVLETANISVEARDLNMEQDMVRTTGQENDSMISNLAYQLADKIANRMVDVLYPAKVVGRTDDQVTINRGDGTGIAAGQMFDCYALGKEMIDPDTNESLGKEEVKVGVVKIISVQPRTSRGQIMDDKGVDVGAVLRLAVAPAAAKP